MFDIINNVADAARAGFKVAREQFLGTTHPEPKGQPVGDSVIVSKVPYCDMCADGRTKAAYDGKTIHGPWAYMCAGHWALAGVGRLGSDYGLRLIDRALLHENNWSGLHGEQAEQLVRTDKQPEPPKVTDGRTRYVEQMVTEWLERPAT